MAYDVIIIGGSYAGLSAGLPLARARRKVLVIDAGQRRNRFAAASHGFLTQDGVPPAEIAAEGRAQLMEYGSVDWVSAEAVKAEREADGFYITDRSGKQYSARVLILATGIVDVLPDIPGVTELWGSSVFHCPYCHGYELQRGRIGVLATSPLSMHQALMLPDWGTTTLLLNEAFEPDEEQLAQLGARGVALERTPVTRLEGDPLEVLLEDNRTLSFAGLFLAPGMRLPDLVSQLNCETEEGPLGLFIKTDPMKATSVPGLFACGDAARAAGSVPLAVGDGAMAGVAAHRALMFGY
ncbi:NAD(P)/FAD-dependent oxidoreductase [Stutzerimonas azotifigens]|uniref:NAD(P)/FAD-dependent oxidoreductase n=1 Tax=Stutzerimonas azotifigens TaxID=291995 RepID=A0ABR5Z1W2_9GAMM|nr:NAD(P)/FAD-dependent oxidoreductase [Stutzerimonas azotifigens]MBA1274181.1 NAD(P)/FAD-dependent oxidoreductase [Stutzerimonas azotifigens]